MRIYNLIVPKIPKPVPEYKFHPTRRWKIDFAWPEVKLAVEIEGGIFGIGKPCPLCKRRSVGAHTSIQRLKSDLEKYNALALAGWRLLRFTPDQVRNGSAAEIIRQFFAIRQHGEEDEGQREKKSKGQNGQFPEAF